MSKLIDIKDYIKLSTYTKKYGVSNRKLYRHFDDDAVDYAFIDGVSFIKDQPYPTLQNNNSGRKPSKSVEPLTFKEENVEPLTRLEDNSIVNQHVKNVEPLTFNEKESVEPLTFKNELNILLNKNENECTISDYKRIGELREILK